MTDQRVTPFLLLLVIPALWACEPDDRDRPPAVDEEEELTTFELEHGLGPFTEEFIPDGQPDPELVAEGERIFIINCESCHRLGRSFVGPDLADALERRSPTFVLNMILNPEEMGRNHPEGQAMLAQYPTVMPYQNISEDQAVAILEYLRTEQR